MNKSSQFVAQHIFSRIVTLSSKDSLGLLFKANKQILIAFVKCHNWYMVKQCQLFSVTFIT